jgi:hypothetical protein
VQLCNQSVMRLHNCTKMQLCNCMVVSIVTCTDAATGDSINEVEECTSEENLGIEIRSFQILVE